MRFVTVGAGFRRGAFERVAAGCGWEDAGAVVRSPRPLGVPTYASLSEAGAVDLVITLTPPPATPSVVVEAVERGLPVLCETPPAPDVAALEELWSSVGATGRVQVAEQYTRMPMHAARLAAVRAGLVGEVTQVHVSSTQTYHATSLIRAYLGVGRQGCTVRSTRVTAPLTQPLSRAGWTGEIEPKPATTTLATLDFGEGKSALYDFTDNQTRNLLRGRRLLVRGVAGEIDDLDVVSLAQPENIVRQRFERWQTGHDVDLNGYRTEVITLGGEVLWRNPWPEERWNDDELAVAALLTDTASWLRGEGPEPYPLADAATDHAVSLAFDEAADADASVRVDAGPWA